MAKFAPEAAERTGLVECVMGPHRVKYPTEDVDEFVMTNGQLMGSPLSFLHLCATNFVALWESIEQWLTELAGHQVHVDPADIAVLINGDDILFPTCERLHAIWEKCVARIGGPRTHIPWQRSCARVLW